MLRFDRSDCRPIQLPSKTHNLPVMSSPIKLFSKRPWLLPCSSCFVILIVEFLFGLPIAFFVGMATTSIRDASYFLGALFSILGGIGVLSLLAIPILHAKSHLRHTSHTHPDPWLCAYDRTDSLATFLAYFLKGADTDDGKRYWEPEHEEGSYFIEQDGTFIITAKLKYEGITHHYDRYGMIEQTKSHSQIVLRARLSNSNEEGSPCQVECTFAATPGNSDSCSLMNETAADIRWMLQTSRLPNESPYFTATRAHIAAVRGVYSCLPKRVQELLEDYPVAVIPVWSVAEKYPQLKEVTANNDARRPLPFAYEKCLGICDLRNGVIAIAEVTRDRNNKTWSLNEPSTICATVGHEVGHFLDHLMRTEPAKWMSEEKEFQSRLKSDIAKLPAIERRQLQEAFELKVMDNRELTAELISRHLYGDSRPSKLFPKTTEILNQRFAAWEIPRLAPDIFGAQS